eukprot:1192816-Prorocentrum_minimum.AAC.2
MKAIGARYGYILSPLLRLVPATGIFSLPFYDWCPLRVYSLSPSVIGARYGYIPLPFCDCCPLTRCALTLLRLLQPPSSQTSLNLVDPGRPGPIVDHTKRSPQHVERCPLRRPRVFNLATPKRFSSRSHHRRPPQSDRAPITDRGREYTCSGHQSRKGRENIPLRLPRTPHGATALITATRYQSVYLFDCFVFARRHLSRNADAHLLEAEGGELLLPFLGSSVNRTFEPSQGPRGVVPATHPNVQTLELGT